MPEQINKYCVHCGASIEDAYKYCPACGSEIKGRTQQSLNIKSAKSKNVNDKSKIRKNTVSAVESENVEKKLSPKYLLYILVALLTVTVVILLSSGIFDNTSAPIQSSTKDFEETHSGVDLQNLEKINELEEQLKNNPRKEVLLELAHLLNDSGLKERAIEKYKEYLKDNPEEPDVLVDMGVCYFDLRNYSEAEKWMKGALNYNPQHQIAHLNLGVVRLNAGNVDEAIEWWKKTVAINPNTEIAKRAQELINSH